MYEKDGVTLSVEDVQLNAKISDITPEAWASKNGFNSIKEEEDPGKPGKTDDSAKETVLAESETMTAAGDSVLANTLLVQPETVNQGRQTQVKGTIVYEDDYLEKYAGKKTGKGNYPDTFEEYAKLNNTEITDIPFSTMLNEVVVTAEMSSETKSDKKQGEKRREERTSPWTSSSSASPGGRQETKKRNTNVAEIITVLERRTVECVWSMSFHELPARSVVVTD